ncbi:unnamed protein product, partial [Prunus brigantina]
GKWSSTLLPSPSCLLVPPFLPSPLPPFSSLFLVLFCCFFAFSPSSPPFFLLWFPLPFSPSSP